VLHAQWLTLYSFYPEILKLNFKTKEGLQNAQREFRNMLEKQTVFDKPKHSLEIERIARQSEYIGTKAATPQF